MQYIIPHYYKKFACIGGDCPDTCCAGWQIMIDPASLKKYRQTKGRLGCRLHNEIDWEEGAFRQYEKRCAFLNEENLCDLYIEGNGSEMFCKTCRLYPRHVEEFEGLREISLSLSCPEAANLILGCEEPVHFLEAENPDREETYEEFDFFLFTKLEDARTLIFQILQNREYPIRLRMAIVLALAHDLQERIDKNALFEIDGLLKRYEKERVWTWFQEKLDNLDTEEKTQQEVCGNLFVILNHLEVLRDDWKGYVKEAKNMLLESELSAEQRKEFESVFTEKIMEQLMVYFVFTYFCGAVYDEQAYGKLKFAVAGCILIRALAKGVFLKNGTLEFSDVAEAARRYAREVEHSDFNKCKMEQMLQDEGKFGLEKLFVIL